ncbi:MAG: acyl-CoA thioesterase [Halobacteriales archaeon]
MTNLDDYLRTDDVRVRFAETDAQGVVFFGSFLTYMDEAVLAYLRRAGYRYEDFLGGAFQLVVAHVDVDYHASARFGDRLANYVRVDDIGERSVTFAYRCRDDETSTTIASGSMVMVGVDPAGDSRPLPAEFRRSLRGVDTEDPDA